MNFLLLVASLAATQVQADTSYLYRARFVRAAPGSLLELIDMVKDRRTVHEAAGETPPFIMRHSQGDQWDLMLLYPMGTFQDYFRPERTSRREQAAAQSGVGTAEFESRLRQHASWQEDLFVLGPSLDVVSTTMNGGDYYHLEIFLALPGRHADLFRQREMENDYLARLGRPQNLIFTRAAGSSWDAFTLGVYRDLKHWAASADVAPERAQAAAIAAGFEGADRIGSYMRTLIQYHHDTIGPAIR